VLINNAALLVTPGPLALADGEALAASVRVGLEAPLMLSQAFLAGTQGRVGDRRILNISSGLGRRAMAGSVAYCAIKAGLDHAARALALEEAEHPQGARIVSLAPGVIDTDMQVQLRGADPSRFPEQARFQNFKDSGALLSSEAAAKLVLAYLARPDFGDTVIADVRDT
jgi:NAD(P)-dependent dehydrogenase (short-subunit alcohol dehydrogenase family)